MTRDRLPVDRGFEMWAPSYESENPLTTLDRLAVRLLAPAPAGGALLDAGCGTGRRLPRPGTPRGPRLVVGLDLVPTMLARGLRRLGGARYLLAARLEAIPLRPGLFDVVWCRLTIGFLPRLEPVFASLAAQLRPGGRLLVTDLHPELAATGAERGFRDEDGLWRIIEARTHPVDRMLAAAAAAGLDLDARKDLAAGPELAESYRAAGREDLYLEHSRRPVLLGLSFRLSRAP